jgi:hypothetical protein
LKIGVDKLNPLWYNNYSKKRKEMIIMADKSNQVSEGCWAEPAMIRLTLTNEMEYSIYGYAEQKGERIYLQPADRRRGSVLGVDQKFVKKIITIF